MVYDEEKLLKWGLERRPKINKKCSTCNATGNANYYDCMIIGEKRPYKKCPTCDGTGKLEKPADPTEWLTIISQILYIQGIDIK